MVHVVYCQSILDLTPSHTCKYLRTTHLYSDKCLANRGCKIARVGFKAGDLYRQLDPAEFDQKGGMARVAVEGSHQERIVNAELFGRCDPEGIQDLEFA